MEEIVKRWHEDFTRVNIVEILPSFHSTVYPQFVERGGGMIVPTLLVVYHDKTQAAIDKMLSYDWKYTDFFLKKKMAQALHRLYSDRTACKITQTVFYLAALEAYNANHTS